MNNFYFYTRLMYVLISFVLLVVLNEPLMAIWTLLTGIYTELYRLGK